MVSSRSSVQGAKKKKKSQALGGGGRFEKMEKAIEAKGKSPEAAKAITAAAGRKKYGGPKMEDMAKKGKARVAKAEPKNKSIPRNKGRR